MTNLLDNLGDKQREGSKPRCHWMTHGTNEQVAGRLTELIEPWGNVSPTDNWMPEGFDNVNEAELDRAPALLDPEIGRQLKDWWLAGGKGKLTTPNFDIASTCTVTADGESKHGLLLVEAKAHEKELKVSAEGKKLNVVKASDDSRKNHERIGEAIREANDGLHKDTSLKWNISRDQSYQMSNRFAWSWKLTELGIPVILVYLGFLNADEMSKPFFSPAAWERQVKSHSRPLCPEEVWDTAWTINGQPFVPLIRSAERPYDEASPEDQA